MTQPHFTEMASLAPFDATVSTKVLLTSHLEAIETDDTAAFGVC